MRLIYYSTAYYASHGGSNHSKAFVRCALNNHLVDELKVFPSQQILKAPIVNKKAIGKKHGIVNFLLQSKLATIPRFYRRSEFYWKDLVQEIQSFKPDAIIIRLDSNFLQLSKLKQQFPTVLLVTEVNASPFDESFRHIAFRSYFKNLQRKVLAQSDLNFFVSNYLLHRIMGNIKKEMRDYVLPNGVDTALFEPSKDKLKSKQDVNLPLDKKIIGYVGTLDVTKRLDVLIKAYGILRKKRKDVFFVIVGDGPERSNLEREIATENLADCTLVTGQIDHEKVPEYLRAFDVAVHHAASEYMCPLKLFEYLAVEMPVVGPDTMAVKEFFEDKKHLLLTACDPQNIVKQLTTLLEEPDFANAMSINGREWVTSRYTWQQNADTVIKNINNLLIKRA